MIALPGGTFTMGSERFYPEEAPVRRVRVDPFRIDAAPVTNRAFARFVAETGYVTFAEIAPDPADYPDIDPALAQPGSLVFTKSAGPVDLSDPSQWWRFVLGADWRHPTGPDSSLEGLDDHPVVHVVHQDAKAYADWAGKSLPTEAEWEYAARGGLEAREFAWGDELTPDGQWRANTWQGLFPFANQLLDGWERTSPIGAYPPNDFGLYDMIGNVWEWTEDWYADASAAAARGKTKTRPSCCVADNPRGAKIFQSWDPANAARKVPRKVIKGGSHLCAPSYCQRYRPAARHPQAIDSSTSHIGFRCVVRAA
ncbi:MULTISPECIES: formylglycine-generating enzyme family protein [unclassified Sphingomonas]|uniref:formylglycine-generating enzyme family protein n=1 Tax=unclassified Sphingomonas TaxID=196159 RepID=UPI0009262AAC|nr:MULTISPECIES: formylglycine-generating enzyme family protein [unclassified Sphingomonas]OJU18050.1 MAG: gliding motility-associated lipoprotein GldK [Sphingomonas sp. 66-10]